MSKGAVMPQYTNSPLKPQAKISKHLDCSFEVGRDLACLARALQRGGFKDRGDHLEKMASRLLNSAADAQIELSGGK